MKNEIFNKIEEINNKIEAKEEMSKREKQESMVTQKKLLEEIETRILTIIEDKQNIYKKQEQEKMLENKKLLKEIEANVINNIEDDGNQKQLQEMKTKIINKMEDEELNCFMERLKIMDTRSRLNMENERIHYRLEKFLDKLDGTPVPRDCQDVFQLGNTSTGVYTILPRKSRKSIEVLCNMDTREGGWTYILNRFDGSQEFYLEWNDFKNGFGSLSGEFWLGLQQVYEMTRGSQFSELLIELVDWENVTKYALYDNFRIGDEAQGYRIWTLGSYSGDAGDSLSGHIGYPFVTKDNDANNNAINWKSAWWYLTNGDAYSNLFGYYNKENETNYDGALQWGEFHGFNYSLKAARMMIRPERL